MTREEEFRSVPRAPRGKRSVEMRTQKQVVSGQSVKSNLSRLRADEDALADAVLDVFYFHYLGNPC